MKNFYIFVSGASYQVEEEEVTAAPANPAARAAKPPAAPAPAAPAAAAAPAVVADGDTPVKAPMPGKIIRLVAEAGKAVKKGDVLMILEAMKMQNEITAPVAGTLKSLNAVAGQGGKPGDVIAVIGK